MVQLIWQLIYRQVRQQNLIMHKLQQLADKRCPSRQQARSARGAAARNFVHEVSERGNLKISQLAYQLNKQLEKVVQVPQENQTANLKHSNKPSKIQTSASNKMNTKFFRSNKPANSQLWSHHQKTSKGSKSLTEPNLRNTYRNHEQSTRIVENNFSKRQAQRELDNRLKKRRIKQYERQMNGQNKQSYQQVYARIKQEAETHRNLFQEKLNLEGVEDVPQVSEDGIKYYAQLKDKPAILEYTRNKIRQKSLDIERLSRLKTPTQLADSFLNFLEKRKNNKQDFDADIPQQWEIDLYQSQIHNIGQVSSRLNKIYKKNGSKDLSEAANQKLLSNPIRKNQQNILDQFNQAQSPGFSSSSGTRAISKESKDKLRKKFGQILKEVAKSMPSKRQQRFKEKVLTLTQSARTRGQASYFTSGNSDLKNDSGLSQNPERMGLGFPNIANVSSSPAMKSGGYLGRTSKNKSLRSRAKVRQLKKQCFFTFQDASQR